MTAVLGFFLLFAALYHLLVTVFVYGLGRVQPEMLVIFRDIFRLVIFFVLAIVHRKIFVDYVKRTWKLWGVLILLSFFALAVSYIQQKTMTDMLVGAKYGMQFFFVFLMATFLGQIFSQKGAQKFQSFLHILFYIFVGIIIVGILWQVGKMFYPEFFYSLGYATFGDWVFGQNPPLYYLTGPGGYARLSGIFSGPNNYGYLFVGLFGFWRRYLRTYVKQRGVKVLLWALFAFSVLWTMSRGAVLGIFLQIIALSFVLFHAKRSYIIGLLISAILIAGALSLIKRGSTMAHVTAKFSSLAYVRANPWGYGLGSSGPSIHTGHGSILPENFFVQILLDIGIPGMILWLLFRYIVLKNIRTRIRKLARHDKYAVLLICLSFGFLGLLLEGMFLHVFEDSMVNYWFFILWGVTYGYLLVPRSSSSTEEQQS